MLWMSSQILRQVCAWMLFRAFELLQHKRSWDIRPGVHGRMRRRPAQDTHKSLLHGALVAVRLCRLAHYGLFLLLPFVAYCGAVAYRAVFPKHQVYGK